jgi:hypothetical protein
MAADPADAGADGKSGRRDTGAHQPQNVIFCLSAPAETK